MLTDTPTIAPDPRIYANLDQLMEIWTPDPSLLARADAARGRLLGRVNNELDIDEIDIVHVNGRSRADTLSIICGRSTGPHADLWHKPWTAIWVLQARPGHKIGISGYWPASMNHATPWPDGTPVQECAVQAGDIVLLNDHHTHWMTPSDDQAMFVGINIDFDLRESRAAIEAQFHTCLDAQGIGMRATS